MNQEPNSDDYLAFFKYKGIMVEDGYLDARKSSEVILGIDEVLRYFIIQNDKHLSQTDFEIPIRVQKGSWEALIPHSLGDWLLGVVGTAVISYTSTAVHKIAENDFSEVRTKDVLKAAIKSIKWVLLISKHMGSMAIKKFRDVKFEALNSLEEQLIGLENEKGELLYVPREYIEIYRDCPEKLFDKLMKNLALEREFEMGFNPKEPVDVDDTNENVSVSFREKYIYTSDEKYDEVLLPELVHGEFVELDGHVTRGNENTNTIGFQYSGHVITCSPLAGNIKDYKTLLFTNCTIKGYVDRSGQYNLGNEKRPHIKYESLQSLPAKGKQFELL